MVLVECEIFSRLLVTVKSYQITFLILGLFENLSNISIQKEADMFDFEKFNRENKNSKLIKIFIIIILASFFLYLQCNLILRSIAVFYR